MHSRFKLLQVVSAMTLLSRQFNLQTKGEIHVIN